jgi:hypothetical protein
LFYTATSEWIGDLELQGLAFLALWLLLLLGDESNQLWLIARGRHRIEDGLAC